MVSSTFAMARVVVTIAVSWNPNNGVWAWIPTRYPLSFNNGYRKGSCTSDALQAKFGVGLPSNRSPDRGIVGTRTTGRHGVVTTGLLLSSSPNDSNVDSQEESAVSEDMMTVQRTLYSLSPTSSSVTVPNALVIEERLRFVPNPKHPGYAMPHGQRTWILRENTADGKPFYRIDFGPSPHDMSSMDSTIATALFLASNPQYVQGQMMEIACKSGLASIIGCIGATAVTNKAEGKEFNWDSADHFRRVDPTLVTPKLHRLTLTDDNTNNLDTVLKNLKLARMPIDKVVLRELKWKTVMRERRVVGSPTGTEYRLVVGSDIDFLYPGARELARVVAHSLLPSDPVAIASTKAESTGRPFGGLGMDLTADKTQRVETKTEIDPKVAPSFLYVCPEANPDLQYLRQFLEKGFLMHIEPGFLKLVRQHCSLQKVHLDASEIEMEEAIDAMGIQVEDETSSRFKSLVVVHHPDYGGAGTGEMFFPYETGLFDGAGGGRSSSMLDTESDGALGY